MNTPKVCMGINWFIHIENVDDYETCRLLTAFNSVNMD